MKNQAIDLYFGLALREAPHRTASVGVGDGGWDFAVRRQNRRLMRAGAEIDNEACDYCTYFFSRSS